MLSTAFHFVSSIGVPPSLLSSPPPLYQPCPPSLSPFLLLSGLLPLPPPLLPPLYFFSSFPPIFLSSPLALTPPLFLPSSPVASHLMGAAIVALNFKCEWNQSVSVEFLLPSRLISLQLELLVADEGS